MSSFDRLGLLLDHHQTAQIKKKDIWLMTAQALEEVVDPTEIEVIAGVGQAMLQVTFYLSDFMS